MTTVSLSNNATVRTWQSATSNTTVASNLAGITLKGSEAAAFLFGKALSSLDASFFGAAGQSRISRQQAAFEFPAGSGNKVSLTEVADALRYKFDTDPLIEYSSDLGATGYSLADINELLRRLNAEYTGRFSFDLLTLRTASTSLAQLTELDGKAADWLLSDLMTDVQRQALTTLALQIKTVAQDWLSQLGTSADPLAALLRSPVIEDGLDLTTTSSTAVPGQTLSIAAMIQRAETALGLSFSSRFPQLFSSGRLHVADVNMLLAAAREASPTRANDLADIATEQGIPRGGKAYTGRSALMLHVAEAIKGLSIPLSATLPPRIGWNDAVFVDPFAPSGAKLSANALIARFSGLGFDPFSYLGTPKPDYLTLSDLNAFLSQLNTALNLSDESAYQPIAFQFTDDYGNNLRPDEAYLNQVIHALSSAGDSGQMAPFWSASYTGTQPRPIGEFDPVNAKNNGLPTTNYWAWSGSLGQSGSVTNIGAGLSALAGTIPGPQLGVIYLRQVSGGASGAYPSGFGAFTWDGSSFSALSTVSGLPVDKANIDKIADAWRTAGQPVDGIEQVAYIPIDGSLPPVSSSWGQTILSNSILGRAGPFNAALAYAKADPNTTVAGIEFGEPPELVQGARPTGVVGQSGFSTFPAMDTALAAAILQNPYQWPPISAPFYPPRVASIQYLDTSGNVVQNLVAGQTYRAVVSLDRAWPASTAQAGFSDWTSTPVYRTGFNRGLNVSNWAADRLRANPNFDLDGFWQTNSPIAVNWDAARATYTGNSGFNASASGSAPNYLWSDVPGSTVSAQQATFVAQASGPAAGTVSISIPQGLWVRYSGLPIKESPMATFLADSVGGGISQQDLPLLGWSGELPWGAPGSQPLYAAMFRDPQGTGAWLTLDQLSRTLARDFAGSADLGSDANGALNLVDWFMGTGAQYSGTSNGWPAAYSTIAQAALAYQTTAVGNSPTFPVVGLGAWSDPTRERPLSEWSIKGAMLSLWWGLNSLIHARGNIYAGAATPPALAWGGGFQPVAAGSAQMGVVASAALTAQTLMSALPATGNTLIGRLTTPQLNAFQALVNPPNASGIKGPVSGELAELRRVFKDRTGTSIKVADIEGLDATSLQQLTLCARSLQSGLLDEAVLQRLGFGERIRWDDPVFFDGLGQPTSLGALLGGRDSALSKRLLALMPQLADLGMRYDDLRRILATAASVDTSISPTQFDDPARAPLSVEGKIYQGGSAVLLRVAAALRSVSSGTYASVPLDANARVFDDPIKPGSGLKWSINDLDLLARRSAGYTALVAKSSLYDTDLDTIARQVEQVAGRVSTIALTSTAVSDAALSWFAKQLVVSGPMPLLVDANQARFTSGGTTKSFMALLADVQRLFGAELAPRLEALGVLQSGSLLTLVNVAALNGFISWEKLRDPSVAVSAITVSPPAPSSSPVPVASYRASVVPLQAAGRELQALKATLESWVPLPATATDAQWRATQQRLAGLAIELGSAAQTALGSAGLTSIGALVNNPASVAALTTSMGDVQARLGAAITTIQVQLQATSTNLAVTSSDLSALMGNWTFASDQSNVVDAQRAQVASVDSSRAALVTAWQTPTINGDGSIRPTVTAATRDASPRSLTGAKALAALVAQSLASLDPASPASSPLDPDAALFPDPAYPASSAVRTLMTGSSSAPRLSLKELAARCQSALGFSFLSDYSPASGPWTIARVGGLIQLLNEALKCTLAAPYTGALQSSALGSAQVLREKIVRADVGELSLASALRDPLVSLVNHLSELTASDLATGGRAALDADGFFDAKSLLFRTTSNLVSPDLSFDHLVAVGNAANPKLSEVLRATGIQVGSRVSARGLNSLIDVLRANLPTLVRATPLVLPTAVSALDASDTKTLEQFGVLEGASGTRSLVNDFKDLMSQWDGLRNQSSTTAAPGWIDWKSKVSLLVSKAAAEGVALPVNSTDISAVVALSDPPVVWAGPTAWLTELTSRAQHVINKANSVIASHSGNTSARAAALRNEANEKLVVPFTAALQRANQLSARLASGKTLDQALAEEKAAIRAAGVGIPSLVDFNTPARNENVSDSQWDLLGWLSKFDVPTWWANSYPEMTYGVDYPNLNFWLNGWLNAGQGITHPPLEGATRYYDSMAGTQVARGLYQTLKDNVTSASETLEANLRGIPLSYGWQELSERLMRRARNVNLPQGNQTQWYQVAYALQGIDPADLPANGSGVTKALFEYPPGSEQRYTLAQFRRLLKEQIGGSFDLLAAVSGDINFSLFNANDRSRLLAAIYRAMPEVAEAMADWPAPLVLASDATVIDRLATAVGANLKALTQTVTINPTPVRTEAELRQDISTGSDVYVNRNGAFFINGVRTRAVDLAVVSRFLVQDSLSAQYKTLMDEMSQRNNIISAARSWVDNVGGVSNVVNSASPPLARAADAVKATLITMGASAWSSSSASFSTALSADNKTALRNTLDTWAANTGSSDILYDITGGRWSMNDFNSSNPSWTCGMTAGVLGVMDERIKAEYVLAPLWSQNSLVSSGDVLGEMTGGRFSSDVGTTNRIRGAERLYSYFNYVAYDSATLNSANRARFTQLMTEEFNRSPITGVDILSEASGGAYSISNLTDGRFTTGDRTSIMNSLAAYINRGVGKPVYQDSNFAEITGLLNTLISNKIRDGDLAQSKLQSITGQLQNNIEAITALIKNFNEATKSMVQALR